MKSSNTFLLIKLVYWFKSVLSTIFDPADRMRIRPNLEAEGRNSKLKSRDKNALNKMNIINYMNVLQVRPYLLRLWSIPLGTRLPPPRSTPTPDNNWSTVDNTHRNNHCGNLMDDFTIEFLTQTLKIIQAVLSAGFALWILTPRQRTWCLVSSK